MADITPAQRARAERALDTLVRSDHGTMTRRELIDVQLAKGFRPIIDLVTDTAAVSRAENHIRRASTGWGPPLGNPNHPDTIAYLAAKETVRNPPKREQYRMELLKDSDGLTTFRDITKAEYEYALSKIR